MLLKTPVHSGVFSLIALNKVSGEVHLFALGFQ